MSEEDFNPIEKEFEVKILKMEDGDVVDVEEKTVGLRKYVPAGEGLEVESASLSMFSDEDARKLQEGDVSLKKLDPEKYKEFTALEISTAFNNLSKEEALNLESNDFDRLRKESNKTLGGTDRNFQGSSSPDS